MFWNSSVKSFFDRMNANVRTMKEASAMEMNQLNSISGRNTGLASGLSPFEPKKVKPIADVILTPYGLNIKARMLFIPNATMRAPAAMNRPTTM